MTPGWSLQPTRPLTVVGSVEFYRHLVGAFTHPDAPELAFFLAEDLPEIFEEVSTGWNSTLIQSRSNEYRRGIFDIRRGVPCQVDALLRPDGVVELERISMHWGVDTGDWALDPDTDN